MEFTSHRPSCEALSREAVLSKDFVQETIDLLAVDESLVPPGSLDNLVSGFATFSSIDSYHMVATLADKSSHMAMLLGGRTGVREGYRLHEHTQAVMNGFEDEYAADFTVNERKLLRTALLFQDIGKSLCIADCGDRHQQAPYNAAVVENLLGDISFEVLSEDDRQAIRLLISHDILGAALKGYKSITPTQAEAEMAEIVALFPACYQSRYRDFQKAIYMSDVSAYTSFRTYIAADTGSEIRCRPGLNEEYEVLELSAEGVVQFIDPQKRLLLQRLTQV
jgi:hypothetical protein